MAAICAGNSRAHSRAATPSSLRRGSSRAVFPAQTCKVVYHARKVMHAPTSVLSLTLLLAPMAAAQQDRLLDPKQGQLEVQVYTASRVPLPPQPATALAWQRETEQLRARLLDEIVFRGEARQWRSAARKVEWGDTLTGPGYRVRKLRFEILPGFWTSAVLYEPERMEGKVPVMLHVNGHERTGIATEYIQVRCINLAKRGILSFNAEWIGMGQLNVPGNHHYRLPQIDLTGTSGLAAFYLEMERSLDILLDHPQADRTRVGVTGLSGGGWQTTLITALDPRITLSVPVAGHSSFVTRAQWPTLDLGDSEQTPSDLASIADYTHLTAMTAPRPLLLINNAKDNCCFRADYAMGPMLQTARHVYGLFGASTDRLRYYINHSDGHNYDRYSREELYRFLRDQFFGGKWAHPDAEIPSDAEVRTAEQLLSRLPADNLTMHTLALRLAKGLPRASGDDPPAARERLIAVLRARPLDVDARQIRETGPTRQEWHLRMGAGAWTVPAIETGPAGARTAVVLVGDAGMRSLEAETKRLNGQGHRVLAIDPFNIGESKIATRDYLFAMLLSSLGERPLGLQASQIAAAARWLAAKGLTVRVEAHGRTMGLAALSAAAIDPATITAARIQGGMRSLHDILSEDLTVDKHPQMFSFGLLEAFDMPQIKALAKQVDLQ
jgi:dienelactone hydrolase